MNCRKIFEDWKYAVGVMAIAVLLVAIFNSAYLIIQSKNAWGGNQYPNSISVTGKGEVVATPDIITFDFTVTEVSESVKSAQDLAAVKINKALDFLKSKGVEEKDIKTPGYTGNPKYEWSQGVCTANYCQPGKETLIGYEVSQTITVKVRDTEKAGELLSGVGAFDVSRISGLSFTVDDTESLKDQARKLAIEDAKRKAEQLEESLGVKFKKIISFNEDYGYPMYDSGMGGYEKYGMMDSVSTPQIPVGESTITSSVYVVYEVK